MILSLFLRHYKVYQGAHYIRVRVEDAENKVSIYLGDNAVGKSSILEALDTYFNGSEWTRTIGSKQIEAFIAPFLAVNKKNMDVFLSENAHALELSVKGDKRIRSLEVLSKIDRFIRDGFGQIKTKDYNELFADFKNFDENEAYDDYYLLFVPLYQSEQMDPKTKGINFILPKERETVEKQEWDLAYEILCHYYKYIYFRVEENPYETLHLENMSFQRLMNKDILADIEDVLNSKNPETRLSVIQSINDNLSKYLENINATLQNTGENFRFTYKRNQPNKITARHLREIVISRFLSVRTLKSESKDLQDLSSGEQRQALIKVASTFIKDTKDNLTGELILAIDEPENSLHIKNLYHQFNSLISLHQYCQVIMTTHWYGILPILNQESLHIVQKRQSREKSNTIEISSYLAEHFFGNKMNYRVEDAANILVKSYFDLTNSIVMMARLGTNFIICEGLTDKRYLEYYLDLQNRHTDNLHIIALGGIANVVKLYKYLYLALSDITSLKKESDVDFGKILCITDLDDYQPDLDVPSCLKDKGESILSIRKIVYDSKEKKSSLLEYSASGNYERIEIEDSLHPEHLFKVLKDILQEEEKTSSLAKKLRFNTKRIHAHSKVDDELDSIFNKENLSRDEIQIVNSLFKKETLIPKIKEQCSKLYIQSQSPDERIPHLFVDVVEILNLKTKQEAELLSFSLDNDLSLEENVKKFFDYMYKRGYEIELEEALPSQRTRNIYSKDGKHASNKKYRKPLPIKYGDEEIIFDLSIDLEQFSNFIDYMEEKYGLS